MAETLERSIEQAFRRIERGLRGLEEQGEEEQIQELLRRLNRNTSILELLFPKPPPPAEPVSQPPSTSLRHITWSPKTFGSNF